MNNKKDKLQSALDEILAAYRTGFSEKVYSEENGDHDLLMDVYGITPLLKRENRQYWGRELGMCWQRLVVEVCRNTRADFGLALRIGADEPCDLTVGNLAIDTKYRIGSGDSGTLKKFKAYGPILKEKGFIPVLLIVREDNLGAAITACNSGGWTIGFLYRLWNFEIPFYLIKIEDLIIKKVKKTIFNLSESSVFIKLFSQKVFAS